MDAHRDAIERLRRDLEDAGSDAVERMVRDSVTSDDIARLRRDGCTCRPLFVLCASVTATLILVPEHRVPCRLLLRRAAMFN